MAASHIQDDDLELYALDRLPEPDAAPVEEHLLVCGACRERLTEWDEYVAAMRAAMTTNGAIR
jgi:anti-sigma factor RsiW